MRLLLNTNVLPWAVGKPLRLDRQTRSLLEDAGNEVQFGAASIWEVAIKASLGRADFSVRADSIAEGREPRDSVNYRSRATSRCALQTYRIDRILVAQLIAEPAWLFTADVLLTHTSSWFTWSHDDTPMVSL
jgi:PIN domain nuclease of toxin-antitoxin system